MSDLPFVGRMPVFVGDDITDEAVFKSTARVRGKMLFGDQAFSRLERDF